MRVTVPSRPSHPEAASPGGRSSSGAAAPGPGPGSRPARRRPAALVAAAVVLPALALGSLAAPASAVVNGQRAAITDTPFVVQLAAGGETFCTGSLIRPQIVLTAAHCLVESKKVRVFVGRQDTQGNDGVELRATKRNYDKAALGRKGRASSGLAVSDDVGLLELERPVTEVAPVVLGTPEQASLLAPGKPLTITGWGVVNDREETVDSSASRTLRSVTAPVRSAAFCRGKLQTSPRGVLCVGRLERPVAGGCYGDSGGPLYAKTPAGAVQMGVVSSSPVAHCGRDTTFYARVQSGPARTWIDSHISPEGRLRGGRPLK